MVKMSICVSLHSHESELNKKFDCKSWCQIRMSRTKNIHVVYWKCHMDEFSHESTTSYVFNIIKGKTLMLILEFIKKLTS